MTIPAPEAKVLKFAGIRQGWAMPLVLCDAPRGVDSSRRPERHPWHALRWRLSGAIVHRVLPDGQRIESLQPNGFVLLPARCELRLVADGPIRYADFRIQEAFVRSLATELAGPRGDCAELLRNDRVMHVDPEVPTMLDGYLRRALDEDEPPTRLEMDSRASLLMLLILRKHSALCDESRRIRRGTLAPSHLRRVCDAMSSDLTAAVSLSQLAAMVGISYHHFGHAFKASTGMPPHRWLVEQRVERACQLLRFTRERVTDIAARVGYNDPNQLTRVFRSRRGTTPALYRREFQIR